MTLCPLCGAAGAPFQDGLTDRVYGVPGTWAMRRCGAGACGLVWLDPMPAAADVPKLYERYYTHASSDAPAPASPVAASSNGGAKALLKAAWQRGPVYRRRFAMYLDDLPPGRLLEVGCGSGDKLADLRALGWTVEGQETDDKAAEGARRRHGLTVHVGRVEDLALPFGSYDAVLLSHVVEHLHDPVATLSAIRRLLVPGGRLVVVTPNVDSYARRRFGAHWVGWDTPRHLHMFTPTTLKQLARKAGYATCEARVTLTNLRYGIGESAKRQGRGGAADTLAGIAGAIARQLTTGLGGEECVALATAPRGELLA